MDGLRIRKWILMQESNIRRSIGACRNDDAISKKDVVSGASNRSERSPMGLLALKACSPRMLRK